MNWCPYHQSDEKIEEDVYRIDNHASVSEIRDFPLFQEIYDLVSSRWLLEASRLKEFNAILDSWWWFRHHAHHGHFLWHDFLWLKHLKAACNNQLCLKIYKDFLQFSKWLAATQIPGVVIEWEKPTDLWLVALDAHEYIDMQWEIYAHMRGMTSDEYPFLDYNNKLKTTSGKTLRHIPWVKLLDQITYKQLATNIIRAKSRENVYRIISEYSILYQKSIAIYYNNISVETLLGLRYPEYQDIARVYLLLEQFCILHQKALWEKPGTSYMNDISINDNLTYIQQYLNEQMVNCWKTPSIEEIEVFLKKQNAQNSKECEE